MRFVVWLHEHHDVHPCFARMVLRGVDKNAAVRGSVASFVNCTVCIRAFVNMVLYVRGGGGSGKGAPVSSWRAAYTELVPLPRVHTAHMRHSLHNLFSICMHAFDIMHYGLLKLRRSCHAFWPHCSASATFCEGRALPLPTYRFASEPWTTAVRIPAWTAPRHSAPCRPRRKCTGAAPRRTPLVPLVSLVPLSFDTY